MKKIPIMLFVLISILLLSGCAIRTPQINGLVLDEETKQPVPEAWVNAMIELNTKTVAGKVHTAITIDQPHTRTDKEGKFVIPSRKIEKSFSLFEFRPEAISLSIGASNVDDIGSRVNYFGGSEKQFCKNENCDLDKFLDKDKAEITMYAKHYQRTKSEYFFHLQSLYSYCTTGRASVEIPVVQGGCDDWELDYVIKKHEKYLERLGEPDPKGEMGGYFTGTLNQLGHLLIKRGNYQESLNNFIKLKEFSKKRNTQSLYKNEIYVIIPKLEKLINGNSTR